MTLSELIIKSKKEEIKIRHEHEIFVDFQKNNPWIVDQIIEDLIKEKLPSEDVPSIEDFLEFKNDLLLIDLHIIYKQLVKQNPLLVNDGPQEILYYSVTANHYKNQLKAGFKLGDEDEEGNLVTGSNLTVQTASLDLEEFLGSYCALNN